MRGLRFHKIISLGKNLKLNLSKSGISLSIGGKGKSINIGKDGVKGTVGLPGTGISYSQKLTDNKKGKKK